MYKFVTLLITKLFQSAKNMAINLLPRTNQEREKTEEPKILKIFFNIIKTIKLTKSCSIKIAKCKQQLLKKCNPRKYCKPKKGIYIKLCKFVLNSPHNKQKNKRYVDNEYNGNNNINLRTSYPHEILICLKFLGGNKRRDKRTLAKLTFCNFKYSRVKNAAGYFYNAKAKNVYSVSENIENRPNYKCKRSAEDYPHLKRQRMAKNVPSTVFYYLEDVITRIDRLHLGEIYFSKITASQTESFAKDNFSKKFFIKQQINQIADRISRLKLEALPIKQNVAFERRLKRDCSGKNSRNKKLLHNFRFTEKKSGNILNKKLQEMKTKILQKKFKNTRHKFIVQKMSKTHKFVNRRSILKVINNIAISKYLSDGKNERSVVKRKTADYFGFNCKRTRRNSSHNSFYSYSALYDDEIIETLCNKISLLKLDTIKGKVSCRKGGFSTTLNQQQLINVLVFNASLLPLPGDFVASNDENFNCNSNCIKTK